MTQPSAAHLRFLAEQFRPDGNIQSIVPLGEGFINDTYKVTTAGTSPNYLLQKKNRFVFPNVPAMMDNIARICRFLKTQVSATGGDPYRETLTPMATASGEYYFADTDGSFWTLCLYIENTLSYTTAPSEDLAYYGGMGVGRFQALLSSFQEPLHETIAGFHNIRERFAQWDAALAADAVGRKKQAEREIDWIESRRESMLAFWALKEKGTLPSRVTHNDTKISNILFDAKTRKPLCMIDLDTVMNSTVLNDVGDALRSYTNTGQEDDPDPSHVAMSLPMYKAWIKGYRSQADSFLCEAEREYLAFSGRYITYEQVLRFLMDYLNGDTYYKIKYPEHNLVRTRAQYALLQSMEAQYEEMLQC